MKTPVFIVTGFLGVGKTTFLNHLLNGKKWINRRLLLIQFESGEEDFKNLHDRCRNLSFSKKMLENEPEQIIESIASCLHEERFDEVWIEWNGVAPFSQLHGLLLHPLLHDLCRIRKVMHIVDGGSIESLLGRTGNALPEQIANSDFVIARNIEPPHDYNKIRRLIRGINPGVEILGARAYRSLFKDLYGKRKFPVQIPLLLVVLIVTLHSASGQIFEAAKGPLNTVINLFSGIMLQAIPFLLIGVLLSTAIQIFLPREMIERRFPKSVGAGILAAVLCGFCLPVCDCASIPIFRSLVRKGVPLPAAVTFLTVTPVINPVVILSTYYAFNGSLNVVLGRVCFGIVSAVLIGVIFGFFPPAGQVLPGGSFDRVACSCGCYDLEDPSTERRGRIVLFLRHSQTEFFSVGKYLVIGALISSILQTFGTRIFTVAQSGPGLVFSILAMMGVAFFLSLCSTSDAVIARSFANQLPLGAVMGFLIFGPMMDLKNVLMLSESFSKGFVGRLLLITFLVCFAVVFFVFGLGGI